MSRYTPEFLAALRHRYENGDQPMRTLAADFGIGISTLSALVEKEGWAKRSQRSRECPPAMHLLRKAEALAAEGASRPGAIQAQAEEPPTPDPILLRFDGQESQPAIASAAAGGPSPPLAALAEGGESLSPAERIEALVVKEIEAEEAAQTEMRMRTRTRAEAGQVARNLAVLTQALQALQRLKSGNQTGVHLGDHDDDMPEDIDAFRIDLARRIDAFVASRTAEDCMADRSAPTSQDES